MPFLYNLGQTRATRKTPIWKTAPTEEKLNDAKTVDAQSNSNCSRNSS